MRLARLAQAVDDALREDDQAYSRVSNEFTQQFPADRIEI